MKVLKARNEGEDKKVLNKAAKIVLKKARYKIGDLKRKLGLTKLASQIKGS